MFWFDAGIIAREIYSNEIEASNKLTLKVHQLQKDARRFASHAGYNERDRENFIAEKGREAFRHPETKRLILHSYGFIKSRTRKLARDIAQKNHLGHIDWEHRKAAGTSLNGMTDELVPDNTERALIIFCDIFYQYHI